MGEVITRLIPHNYTSLLEVGAGNGDLTARYIHLFEDVVLLEPTHSYHAHLVTRFPEARVVRRKIEEFRHDGAYFDFIVASHVLFYVEYPCAALGALWAILDNGGRLVVIQMDRDCGYGKFLDRFYHKVAEKPCRRGEKAGWRILASYLAGKQIAFDMIEAVSSATAPSIDAFLSINDFHFNQAMTHCNEILLNEMRDYLRTYMSNNGVKIDVAHKLIIITK